MLLYVVIEEPMLSNAVLDKTLESSLDSKELSDHSVLKETNAEYSLEGLMLKLKLQYSGHLTGRANSSEMTLMLGKIEGKRRSGWQGMRWLDSLTGSMGMNLSKLLERVEDRGAWCAAVLGGSQRVRHDLATKHHHHQGFGYMEVSTQASAKVSCSKSAQN